MRSAALEQMTDLDKGRRKARRYMAWLSFLGLIGTSVAVWSGTMLGEEAFRLNLTAATPLIVALLWCKAAVVGAYLGVSVTEAIQKGKGK
jgi:hypothetical protein